MLVKRHVRGEDALVDEPEHEEGDPSAPKPVKQPRFLRPLSPNFQIKNVFTFDIETKNDETQEKGWTRPFILNFYDGEQHKGFVNDSSVMGMDWRTRHLAPDGLADRFMHYVLQDFQGGTPERFQAKNGTIYSHNGGRFDDLFILGWLTQRRDYQFEISSVQSRIQRLDVWPSGGLKEEGYWTFQDSVCLLPMSLQKVGETFCPNEAKKMAMDLDVPENVVAVESKVAAPMPKTGLLYGVVREKKTIRVVSHEALFEKWERWNKGDHAVIGGVLHVADRVASKQREWLQGEEKLAVRVSWRSLGKPLEIQPGDLLIFTRWPSTLDPDAYGAEPFDLWQKYNEVDCEVLHKGLMNFQRLLASIGTDIGVTTPATAMKLFRRRFQKSWIPRNAHFKDCDETCHRESEHSRTCDRIVCDGTCHGCAHDFIRKGFYGGRTELFEEWGRDVHYYDLNSSYPASMQFGMPVGDMKELGPCTLETLIKKSAHSVGFVECTVEIPTSCLIPPLPYRSQGGETTVRRPDGKEYPLPAGKLIFPVGRFTGVWDFEELALLFHPLVNGRIISIHRSVWYKKKPAFREMVQTLYEYRKKHLPDCEDGKCKGCKTDYNPGLAEVAKLMLNAFFGKTGMREERSSLVYIPPSHDWRELGPGAKPVDGNPDTCRIWEVERIASAPYVMPQFAAHITAISRRRLFLGMCDVLSRGGKILYCDTDSIIASIPLSDEMIDQTILGKWKNELPGLKIDGRFILPKLYQLIAHEENCNDPHCNGCRLAFHQPTCKSKACKGCSATKQRMKGVGSSAQTGETFDLLNQCLCGHARRDHLSSGCTKCGCRTYEGHTVRFDRVEQHKTMLKRNQLFVTALKDDSLYGGVDRRASKSVRTYYDKRSLRRDGSTLPLVLDFNE